MDKRKIYIHDYEGIFPGARNIKDFWNMIKSGDVAPLQDLESYWGSSKKEVNDDLVMKVGHILDESGGKNGSRQVLLGQKVLKKIHERLPSTPGTKIGLILATEWTDPSFYQAELGDTSSEDAYSVEKQLETLGHSIGIDDKSSILAVDTACASGIYAVHIAREWLACASYEYVIVLGLNAYLHQFLYKGFSKLGALSSSEKLSSFSQSANGIVPGEAVCAIALSSQREGAIAEVNGIGLSCDGREGSAFSPGFNGQLEAYRRAYQDLGISQQDISYIEAHGTATKLGDEIELKSISSFFCGDHRTHDLYIGASKANFGHTLAASGVLALVKAALMIKNKTLPPLKNEEGFIFDDKSIIKATPRSEKFRGQKLHVGISSFGFGGSNGHLILSSPSESKPTDPEQVSCQTKELFVYDYESLDAESLAEAPEVLSRIPLGPKMQKRIDPFQRHAINLASKIIKRYSLSGQRTEELSCIFLNNLGGRLSIDFEKKFKHKLEDPQLSLEAVASTLPSMLSGNIAQIFDLRGTHMLLSSSEEGVVQALELAYSYSLESHSAVLLGLGHANFSAFDSREEGMGIFLLSSDSELAGLKPVACMTIEQEIKSRTQDLRPMAEATGLTEILDILRSADQTAKSVRFSQRSLKINNYKKSFDDHSNQLILKQSELNKKVVLSYLDLYFSQQSRSQENTMDVYGDFLKSLSSRDGLIKARLVVPEDHGYFYDHPLDHVPGIAVVHGCEELLSWQGKGNLHPSKIAIRFKKFIEKDSPCYLKVNTKVSPYHVKIIQGDTILCHIEMETASFHPPVLGKVKQEKYIKEDKKITHKHDEINVLVSSLDDSLESCTALPLEYVNHTFFKKLMSERPSLLYYLEVTRQFVMLMAHLVKKIPLESKMNLISVDVNVKEWVKPPFKLKLINFTIQKNEDFSLASIEIEYIHEQRSFGSGMIKAQVVDREYYEQQRKGVKS